MASTDAWGVPTNLSAVEGDLIARSLEYARKRAEVGNDPASLLNGSIGATEIAQPQPVPDLVGRIIAFESGGLSDTDTLELFQDLVNSGAVWHLQGSYGRTAARLIAEGYIAQPGERAS